MPANRGNVLRDLLGRRLAFLVGFGAVLLGSIVLGVVEETGPTSTPPVGSPVVEGGPGELVERHDCWTGSAPADMAGVVPGHVVVTRDGQREAEYGGPRLVGLALEQVFEGDDHGLTVHAFCR